MGWYGDYESTKDVVQEMKLGGSKHLKVLEEKTIKNKGALLIFDVDKNEKFIDYFIFADGMYKPLHWTDGIDFIPEKWIKRVLDCNASTTDREAYEDYKSKKEEKKENNKIMNEFLKKGFQYRIARRSNPERIYTYEFKLKRTHIFSYQGNLIKFPNLKLTDIQEVTS